MNIGSIIDLLVVALFFVYAVKGFMKGFVKTFFSTFGTILALLFAVLLASKVALTLENNFGLISTMSDKISGALIKKFGANIVDVPVKDATENLMKNAGIDGWIINIILSAKADSSIPETTTVSQILCPTLGYYTVLIISVIGLFIIFKILFFIIADIVKSLHKVKVVGAVDKLLGMLLGLVSAFVALEFIIMITGIIPINFIQKINHALINSNICGFLHKINLFSVIMQWISKQDILSTVKKLINKV